ALVVGVAAGALAAFLGEARVRAGAFLDVLAGRRVAGEARRVGNALERNVALVALVLERGVRLRQRAGRGQRLEIGARAAPESSDEEQGEDQAPHIDAPICASIRICAEVRLNSRSTPAYIFQNSPNARTNAI